MPGITTGPGLAGLPNIQNVSISVPANTTPTSGLLANGGSVNDSLLASSVSEILGLSGQAATDQANAQAQNAAGTGYGIQAGLYNEVGNIAASNAQIAQASGDVQKVQEQQRLALALGTGTAAISGSGFRVAGSARDILRSSLQQGYLQQQLTETQTALTKGGFLAQQAGAQAEGAGATAAQNSAAALGASYTTAGQLATANAANATSALTTFLKGSTLTPAENLVLNQLSANPDVPTALTSGSLTKNNVPDAQGIKDITYTNRQKTQGSFIDANGQRRTFMPQTYSTNGPNFYQNINGTIVSVSAP